MTDVMRTPDVCGQCFAALEFSPHVVAVDMHDGNIILRRLLSKAGELDRKDIVCRKVFLLLVCERSHEFVHERLLHIRLSASRGEGWMQFGGNFPRAEAAVHPCVCRLPVLTAREGQPGVGDVDCWKDGVLPLLELVEEGVQPLLSNVASVRRKFECPNCRAGTKSGGMDQEFLRERGDDGGQKMVVHMLRKEKERLAAADVAHTRYCRHGRPVGVLRPLPRCIVECIRSQDFTHCRQKHLLKDSVHEIGCTDVCLELIAREDVLLYGARIKEYCLVLHSPTSST